MQNHLMQVLSIVAMEPPVAVAGPNYSNHIRDEKVKVLRCIPPIKPEDVVIGQYTKGTQDKEPGYLEDPTVPKGSNTPTFAIAVLWVNNPRWEGVPFIMRAGKALDERKAEVRIQMKDAPGAKAMFDGQECARNEIVLKVQPDEAIWMKTNFKQPGLHTKPIMAELEMTYKQREAWKQELVLPEAYTRLVLDVLRGKQATFVRNDELEAAWDVFDPLLKIINEDLKRETKVLPVHPYDFGTRGPAGAQDLIDKYYVRNAEYQYSKPK